MQYGRGGAKPSSFQLYELMPSAPPSRGGGGGGGGATHKAGLARHLSVSCRWPGVPCRKALPKGSLMADETS